MKVSVHLLHILRRDSKLKVLSYVKHGRYYLQQSLFETDILKFSFKKLHFPLGLKQYSQDHLLLDKIYI